MTLRAWHRLGLAAVTLVAVACGDPRPRPGPPRRQAILILLDAARADRFSTYGYAR